jgi:hypothetical protein
VKLRDAWAAEAPGCWVPIGWKLKDWSSGMHGRSCRSARWRNPQVVVDVAVGDVRCQPWRGRTPGQLGLVSIKLITWLSQPSPLKRISSRDSKAERIRRLDLGIGLKEVWEILLKIRFCFSSCFFFSVVIP